ncbi:MAG TPA: GNAT family N-acetyltransferase [Baekduia sp.]
MDTAIAVTDQAERERFEITAGGELAGFTQYRRRPGLIAFVHTEIDPRYEGRGLASTLIGQALDAARAEDLAVLPYCPFVNAYINKHPEYADLVPETYRSQFGV